MDTNYISEHIKCTPEEKLLCMETAEKLLLLTQAARQEGLLVLEALAEQDKYASPPMLRLGIQLVVNGTDPSIIEEIFSNYMITSQLKPHDFLDHMLVYKGVLAIQQGENPEHIKEILCSLFGLEFRERFYAYFNLPQPSPEIPEFWETYADKLNSFPKEAQLDCLASYLDNRSIQRLIREIPPSSFLFALAGSSLETIKLFLNNMGKQTRQRLLADMAALRHLDSKLIIKNQSEIIAFAKQLAGQGEIILMRPAGRMLNQDEITHLLENK